MAKATKLPSGTWRIVVSYTDSLGKYKQKSLTAPSKAEVELKASQFLVNQDSIKDPDKRTLGMLMDAFIENRTNLLSPSTIAGYEKMRRNAFKPIIDVSIKKLSKEAYQKAINEYSKEHSPKSVANAHAFANSVLKANDIFIAEKTLLPQKEKKEKQIPTIDEVKAFVANIQGSRIYLPVILASYLGLRHSEVIAIKWKDIDLDKKQVSINKARVKDEIGTYVEKKTKTTSGTRVLTMPQILIDALPEKGEADDYLIEGSIDALDSEYKRTCTKLGFPYSFHTLRHFYASVLLMIGMPNKYAQERMGHATDRMLNDVYQHTFEGKKEEYSMMLDKFFSKEFGV